MFGCGRLGRCCSGRCLEALYEGRSHREKQQDCDSDELYGRQGGTESKDVKEVGIDYLEVHKDADCRRVDALVHARAQELSREVTETGSKDLNPSTSATISKLWPIGRRILNCEPNGADNEASQGQVNLDDTEVYLADSSRGNCSYCEKTDDDQG